MRVPRDIHSDGRAIRMVVAIPAKDEAARLPICLSALARQSDGRGGVLKSGLFGVIVYANNCRDDSAEVSRLMAPNLPFPLRVVEERLPPARAHAGGARRRAMDLADDWLDAEAPDGVILTTDADSEVSPTWICANIAAFDAGADAVLGRIAFDKEGDDLSPALRDRGQKEGDYEKLLAELSARLDPQDCNPWPHHSTISGASVAVVQRMYRRVGGLPEVALGEEKAFVARLRRHDARLRFAPDVFVVTSARLTGRAAGGVADTLRHRDENPAALCDEALEPCAMSFRRALWRGRLRRGGRQTGGRWRQALRLSHNDADDALRAVGFGEAWDIIERASPTLTRQRLRPADLPRQIAQAARCLDRLQRLSSSLQNVEAILRAPVVAHDVDLIA